MRKGKRECVVCLLKIDRSWDIWAEKEMKRHRHVERSILQYHQQYNTMQYSAIHYTTIHYTTLHNTTLHHTTLHYTTLHHTTLHYKSSVACTYRTASLRARSGEAGIMGSRHDVGSTLRCHAPPS